ncbi:PREDICTED: probable glycosyltransferase At3g07620 isoform X1 [Ipomoea nil]|uniref:probable glycosyltransferase At3g07620 isoform X1 n=1 Tax=Ipomoea nil TaxID=35883 RepID=UPI000901B16D|nr:PREDICTED: probable glycosyltransferase At3g07620 isoform X1 [Ipomoea nil]
MGIRHHFQLLFRPHWFKLLFIVIIVIAATFLLQLLMFPFENYTLFLSASNAGTSPLIITNPTFSKALNSTSTHVLRGMIDDTSVSSLDGELSAEKEPKAIDVKNEFSLTELSWMNASLEIVNDRNVLPGIISEGNLFPNRSPEIRDFTSKIFHSSPEKHTDLGFNLVDGVKKDTISVNQKIIYDTNSTRGTDSKESSLMYQAMNNSSSVTLPGVTILPADERQMKYEPTGDFKPKLIASGFPNDLSKMAHNSTSKKGERTPISISLMNSLLLRNSEYVNSMRARRHSMPERELQKARFQIENAIIVRNVPEVHMSIFRNYSTFRRSYELMEHMLKVYIYREGEKPIFHQPYLRGIYASEGWFMKLMEVNKQFVVRDPKKAHLFYLPFSSLKLRDSLRGQKRFSQKRIEYLLSDYINLIARKHRFWNRTKGADHFLVACHDWAPKFTRKGMDTCIRALCNTNIASGFQIGKDVSLPVTYVRSAENPLKDLGGNLPSERSILAFFAGGMHGYLRPILLQHWSNKVPDMKIFGPMPRDIESKERYREFMRGSRFCICARGYEVHTPRVVESIHYGCIPVIISDNYVPPFFEVLNWETFSVFILEKDVPNLRNILLSIPEERYMVMQRRLKIVQRYFLWHKNPVRYDLFHMLLHSIWYNRVFQVKPR